MDQQNNKKEEIPQAIINAAIQKWSSGKATPISIKRIK